MSDRYDGGIHHDRYFPPDEDPPARPRVVATRRIYRVPPYRPGDDLNQDRPAQVGEDVTTADGRTFFHPYNGGAPWEVHPRWIVRFTAGAGEVYRAAETFETLSEAEVRASELVSSGRAVSATVEPA